MAMRRSQHAPPARAGGPQYGDIDPSDEVHDEIRAVAAAAKGQIARSRMPQDEAQLLDGVQRYGLAPGAQKLMNAEMAAALWSIEQGTYVTFRTQAGGDCTRVGPDSRCFCRCPLRDHDMAKRRVPCRKCACSGYRYIPKRPEECGMGHLPRRKGFDITQWSPRCRCKHFAHEHEGHGRSRCLICRCGGYESDWCCVVCDRRWEEHETVFESERERRSDGRKVGADYRPLSDVAPEFSQLVYGTEVSEGVYQLPDQTPYQRRIKAGPSGAAAAASGGAGGGRRGSSPAQQRGAAAAAGGTRRLTAGSGGGGGAPPPPVAAGPCPYCSAQYTSATARFCPQCGAPRPRPSDPFA